MTHRAILAAGAAVATLALAGLPAAAKDLHAVGLSVGSLSNPYFIALAEGATNAAHKINPDAHVTVSPPNTTSASNPPRWTISSRPGST